MMRQACARNGHRWDPVTPGSPIEFCARWFCDGERVAPHVAEPLAAQLQYLMNTAPKRRKRKDAALAHPWRVL